MTKCSLWAPPLLFFTSATALGYTTIQFNADNRQEKLQVSGKDCSALLDDDTNYVLTKVDDHTFIIATKAASERSALLLIDCEGASFPYTLTFNNHSKYEYEETRYKEGITRPNNYVGYSHFATNGVGATNTFEVFDQSYNPLGVAVSRTYFNGARPENQMDSVDLFHYWDDYSVSYGASSGTTWSGRQNSFRTYVAGFGAAFGTQQTYRGNGANEQNYIVSSPIPIPLRFLYHQTSDGALDRKVQSNIFGHAGLLTSNTLLEIERYIYSAYDQEFSQLDAVNDLNYLGLPWIKPGVEWGGFFRKGIDSPKLNLARMKSEFRYETAFLEVKYGLVPHDISALGRYRFHRGQEASIMVNQNYAPLPWVKRQTWISNESSPGVENSWAASAPHSTGLLHLEYTDSPYTFTADHNIPLQRNSMDEKLFGRLGIQLDKPRLVASASVGFPYGQTIKIAQVLFEIRYYPDANIKALIARSYTYDVSGKVLSIFGDQPILGATVALVKDDKEVAHMTTTKDGAFTFHNVRAGKYEVVARKSARLKKSSLELSGEKREATTQLVLDDYAKVRVAFFLANGKQSEFSPADSPIDIANFLPELGEGIVSGKDAGYKDNIIWLPRQGKVELKVTPELLPFGYEFLALKGKTQDTDQEGEGLVQILLRKKS